MCARCFSQKLSCQTSEASCPKKTKEPEEPMEGEESKENDGSGEVWMRRFSMMKVGPPKGVKLSAYQNKMGEKPSGAGGEAKRQLEQYHE